MLKELLLQFFLSLLPVFSFQLWHDKERGWNGFRSFIVVLCGFSMVLCMLTSPNLYDYEVSFAILSMMIGSLYGGHRALAGLSLLFIMTQILMLDSTSHILNTVVFTIIFVALMHASIPSFKDASPAGKIRKGLVLLGLLLLLHCLQFNGYFVTREIVWSLQGAAYSIVGGAAILAAGWYSIYRLENIKKKQALYDEVKQISDDYYNEVKKLQQFIDKASIGVLLIDHNRNITHVNEMAVKQLNLQPSFTEVNVMLGLDFSTVFPTDEEASLQMLTEALGGKAVSLVPIMENEKILLYTSVTLRDVPGNRILGAALITQDITELSHLRDEVGRMERLSLVGQMAASITHEIRNPMAVIRGFVQLIQERSPQNQYEYFRIIMDELDRANLIISDFLSLAQNRELKMELASLHSCINELVPLLSADANMRGQSLEVELCDDLPLIMLNNREIKQLLLNIARNGMEAMDDKGVLRLSTSYDDRFIYMRISDEGNGIALDKTKHLFEPFFTTKTRGTGLGLPLCLSIAERHNGRIEVESKENEGTTFIVIFSIAKQETVTA